MASAAASTLQTPGIIESLSHNTHFVGSAWMISSSLLTTYSTTKFLKHRSDSSDVSVSSLDSQFNLRALPRPVLLTLYRFSGSLLFGLLLHPNLRILERLKATMRALSDFALPAAFLFIANFANSVSLDRIGISLTYTTKCCIPIITVLFTLILDGFNALPPFAALLSLLPIAVGIAAASWNSPTFESIGFIMALLSCVSQTALNVTSKRAMLKTGIAGPGAQRAMVAVGFAVTSSLVLVQNLAKSPDEKKETPIPPLWLSGLAVTSYHIEYILSFMFVKLVAPVTYGACDAIRRLSIIVSGNFMFGGDRFTKLNLTGIALALLGALSYAITSGR